MLYVFHVDVGQMTTYDMSLTLQSVGILKSAIEKKTKIPASSLVLLVSGGEVLQADHMVSSYSAGTDTNPIYLFCKPSVKDSYIQQSMCDLSPIMELGSCELRGDSRSAFDGKSLSELKTAVERCCSLPRNLDTIMSCANLAIQFSNLAHDVSRSCDQLVHEQHLQHQGWAAVVANLEDIYAEFCERSKSFKEAFRKHRLKKEEYHDLLNCLNEVMESLGKIPILPALQLNAEAHRFSAFDVFEETDFEGHHYGVNQPLGSSSETRTADFGTGVFKLSEEDVFDLRNISSSNEGANSSEGGQLIEESDEGVTFKAPSVDSKEEPTLLHWILAQGNKASLQDILDYCQKGLALIDAEPLKEREAELYSIISYANMHGFKQIKGIEDRLYGLDQLLSAVKKIERDQRDQAASLIQYRERLNTVCDPSVLPTLVESHWRQLEKLLKGHQDLVDIRRRIAKSKEELSHNLKVRLETVLTIENSMSVQDAHAMLSFQCFNRLARYFGVVAQLHRAPAVFVRAVHEVARRRAFSHAHLRWAAELAEKLRKIHEEEVARRQEFNAHFDDHFLRTLFPGMTDLPPPFATQAPPAFDAKLPKLTADDVEFVSGAFPDLGVDVPKYDMDHVIKFFQQRLNASQHEERDVDVQVDFEKDFESETDTEFEKLSRQSGLKHTMDISTTCVPETMAVSTVTEDNMDTHKLNVEKLQDFLAKIFCLCKLNITLIKDELRKLKKDVDEQKDFVHNIYKKITEAWERNQQETQIRFREHTQRLTVDHELELSDMKAALSDKDITISNINKEMENLKVFHRNEISKMECEHQQTKNTLERTREAVKELENKLVEFEARKQVDLKEMQEKMHLEYKAEIESLRSRFRLVALTNNMDRSPSESSLEKIERTDVIEISNHNAIVMQTKENAEVEKERAVKDAIEKCKEEFDQKLNAEIAALKVKYETDKQVSLNDVSRRLLSEKDRQLELLRERELQLLRERDKYRDTIQQLTDPETNDYDSLLKAQFSTLENEKALLQQQVTELKKELEKKNDEAEKSREDENSDGRNQRLPASRLKSSMYLVGGLPILRFSVRGRHFSTLGTQRTPALRTMSPAHYHFRSSPRRRARCHTPLGLASGSLSLSACLPGHTVLLLWDPHHLNYTVLQESPMMYFVHSDCLPALDLSIHVKNESERRLYAIGTVESKDYCYAKKNGNRYHMLRGSRFYRVRVKPLKPHLPYPSCCDPRHKQDAASVPDATRALLPVFSNRPLKKWLTYVHAKDAQKSVDTSQSTSSATDEASRVEVATGTLINLESPVSGGDATAPTEQLDQVDQLDQLDSIQLESSAHWHASAMQGSTSSIMTDMECSVGRCPAPELTPPPELAEEAAP